MSGHGRAAADRDDLPGYLARGGFGLVCASDIVIAGESAKFLAGATQIGMAPDGIAPDAGTSVTLPLLVGLRKAMEIIPTNPVLTAQEALAGLSGTADALEGLAAVIERRPAVFTGR